MLQIGVDTIQTYTILNHTYDLFKSCSKARAGGSTDPGSFSEHLQSGDERRKIHLISDLSVGGIRGLGTQAKTRTHTLTYTITDTMFVTHTQTLSLTQNDTNMCLWGLGYLSISSSFHTSEQPLARYLIAQIVF